MAPVEITEPDRAEHREDVRLEQLRVAAARLGLELERRSLEPALRVLIECEIRIVHQGDSLPEALAPRGGLAEGISLRREERPMALAVAIAIVDFPHAAALSEPDHDQPLGSLRHVSVLLAGES